MTRVVSRDLACPTCGAQPGEQCRGRLRPGRPVDSHYGRRLAAKEARDDARTEASNRVARAARQRRYP